MAPRVHTAGTDFPQLNLHLGDYLRHTRHLRAAEHGAYLLLIMHYWVTGELPHDDRQLASIACMSLAQWRKSRAVIEPLFEPNWRLGWLDAEFASALKERERRSKAGKKGNDVRWNKKRYADVDRHAFGSGSQCDRNAIASGSLPPASPHSKDVPAGGDVSF